MTNAGRGMVMVGVVTLILIAFVCDQWYGDASHASVLDRKTEARLKLPFTAKQFGTGSQPESGYIVMNEPESWGGLCYAAVCQESQIKRYLKADGALPDDWSNIIDIPSETIAFMNCAGAPYPKGSRVKIQRCFYPRNGEVAMGPRQPSTMVVIVGYDQ